MAFPRLASTNVHDPRAIRGYLLVNSVEVSNRIRDFIREELLYGDASAKLDNDTALLGHVIDSLGLMQLVAFLEQEFQIEVDDSDITTDHFRTIADIERLVTGRAGQG